MIPRIIMFYETRIKTNACDAHGQYKIYWNNFSRWVSLCSVIWLCLAASQLVGGRYKSSKLWYAPVFFTVFSFRLYRAGATPSRHRSETLKQGLTVIMDSWVSVLPEWIDNHRNWTQICALTEATKPITVPSDANRCYVAILMKCVTMCLFRLWSLGETRLQLSVRTSRDEQQAPLPLPPQGHPPKRHLEQEVSMCVWCVSECRSGQWQTPKQKLHGARFTVRRQSVALVWQTL